MNSVSFKSPRDGSVLELTVLERRDGEIEFEVSVRTPWFSGRAPASTFMNGSPAALFDEMARSWTGWNGEKSWKDLEDRVILRASSDRTGHISLRVELVGQDYDSRLVAVIEFEAGQLEAMVASVKELIP